MVILIESYRDVLMYQRWPSFTGLAIVGVASLVLVAIGLAMIRRYDQEFPKLSM
jgi:ABC-type polysaccharide/polyol phosphate export permease